MQMKSNDFIFSVEFSAICHTQFGESVFLCGNIPELGGWNPYAGLRLHTDPISYPCWQSYQQILVRADELMEFKLCKIALNGNLRWEQVQNRNVRVPTSCTIRIFEEILKVQVNYELDMLNRNTMDVLLDLESDSSSSVGFRKEYKIEKQFLQKLEEDFRERDFKERNRQITSNGNFETPPRRNYSKKIESQRKHKDQIYI